MVSLSPLAMRQLTSKRWEPLFRQCQTKPRKRTEDEGYTGILTSHTVLRVKEGVGVRPSWQEA